MSNSTYWQNIPKQTIFGFGEGKERVFGNCFQCCVGAIIDVPAQLVPHFVEQEQLGNYDAAALAQTWLNQRGFWFVTLRNDYYLMVEKLDGAPILPVICCGPTIRSKNSSQTHCVVMDGDVLLYDPHPSDAGLLAVTSRYLIVPFFGIRGTADFCAKGLDKLTSSR
jgi:hypothetical protein